MAGRSLISPKDLQQGRSLLSTDDFQRREGKEPSKATIPEASFLSRSQPGRSTLPVAEGLLNTDDVEFLKNPKTFLGKVSEATSSGDPADLVRMHIERVSEAVGKLDQFLGQKKAEVPGPGIGISAGGILQGAKSLLGLGELTTNFASFIPAGFAATLAAAGRAKEDGLQTFPDTFNSLLESLTYHPKSDIGSAAVNEIVEPSLTWLLETMPEQASEWVWETTGSPELAFAARVGIPAVALGSPLAVGRRSVRKGQESLQRREPDLKGEPARTKDDAVHTIEGDVETAIPGEPFIEQVLNKRAEDVTFSERATIETATDRQVGPRLDRPDSILADQIRDVVQSEGTRVQLGENLQRYLEQAGPEAAQLAPEIGQIAAQAVETGKVRRVSVFGSTLRLGKGMHDVDLMFDLDLSPSKLGKDPAAAVSQFVANLGDKVPRVTGQMFVGGFPVQPFFRVGDKVFTHVEGPSPLLVELGSRFAVPPKIKRRPLTGKEASILRQADRGRFPENRAIFEIVKSMSSKDIFSELSNVVKTDTIAARRLVDATRARLESVGFRLAELDKNGIEVGPLIGDPKKPNAIVWEEHKGRTVKVRFDPETGKLENPAQAMALIEDRIAFGEVSIQALAARRKRAQPRQRQESAEQGRQEPVMPTEEVPIASVENAVTNPVGVARADLIKKNVLPSDATFSELQQSLFEVRKTSKNGKIRRRLTPRMQDIGLFTREFTGRMVPPRKIARLHNDHPLLKWIADRLSITNRKIEKLSDDFLWGLDFVPGRLGVGTARRFSTPQRTARGGLTQFWRMPSEKQSRVTQAMVRWDREGVQPGKNVMEARGFDPEMIASAESLYQLFERVREHVNSKVGHEVIKARPGFIPHIFQGDFAIFVNNAKGELIAAPRTNSKRGAIKIAAEAKRQLEPLGYTVNWRAIRTKQGLDVDALREVSRAVRGMKEGRLIEQRLEQIIEGESFKRFFRERKGVLGYMGSEKGRQGAQSFMKAVQAYTEGAIRYAEMLDISKTVGRALINERIGLWFPNAQRVGTWMYHQATGRASAVERVVQTFAVDMLKRGESFFTNKVDFVNDLTRIMKLYGGNIRYLLANGLQPWLVTPAKLLHLKGAKNMRSSVIRANTLAAKDFFFPSEEAKAALREAFEWKTIDPKFLSTDSLFHQAEILGGHPLSALDVVSGRRLAGRVEEYARMMSFLQFYHFLRGAGVEGKLAREGARYLTDDYMVLYTGTDRPILFHQLGTVGKSVAVFKTFQFDYLAQQVEYVKTAKEAPAALATFVGAQVFMGGLMGVIAITQADYLLHKLGYPTLTQILLESGLPDWSLWGPPSAALDFDLTTTTAAPGLGVRDLISAPGWEYVGKAVIDGMDYGIKRLRGVATPADEMRFLRSIAPTSMQGMIEKYYSSDDLVIIPKRGGVGQFRRESGDWLKRYLSGRSLRESRIIKGMWAAIQMERNRAYDIDALADLGAWHMVKFGDIPEFVFTRGLEDFEVRPRDMWLRIRTRADNLSQSMLEQFTNLERTAAGRRRAEMLRAMGIDPEDVRGETEELLQVER